MPRTAEAWEEGRRNVRILQRAAAVAPPEARLVFPQFAEKVGAERERGLRRNARSMDEVARAAAALLLAAKKAPEEDVALAVSLIAQAYAIVLPAVTAAELLGD